MLKLRSTNVIPEDRGNVLSNALSSKEVMKRKIENQVGAIFSLVICHELDNVEIAE